MKTLITILFFQSILLSQVHISTVYNYPTDDPILKGLYSVRACTVGNDVDGDGKQELAVTNYADNGRVHIFEFNGEDNLELVWTSPSISSLAFGNNIGSYETPRYIVFADMDEDGRQEIVFQLSANGFYFYEWDGVVGSDNYGTEPAFILSLDIDDLDGYVEYFEIEDIDNDGENELITIYNANGTDNDGYYIFEINSTFPGFATSSLEWKAKRIDYPNYGFDGSPYAMISANLDGIGNKEILIHNWNYKNVTPLRVTATNTYEMAVTTNGKQNLFLNPTQDDVSLFGGLAYDIDGDGREEIYLPTFTSDIQGIPNNRIIHMIHYEDGQSTSEIDASNVFALDFSSLLPQDNVDILGFGYGDIDNDSKPNLYFGVKHGGDINNEPYYGPNIVTAEFQGGSKTDPANWTYEVLYEGNSSIYDNILIKTEGGKTEKQYNPNYAMPANFWGRSSDVDNDGKEDIVLVYQQILPDIDVYEVEFNGVDWDTTNTYTTPNEKRFTIRVLEYGESKPQLSSKIFLEGSYKSGSMEINLNTSGVIPLEQPYNTAPWNYDGTESVNEIPANVVDWVLLELVDKNDRSNVVKQQAAFILSNGDIVDLDGVSPVQFYVDENDYFLVIKHRNHLSVMSAEPLYLSN